MVIYQESGLIINL